ncbi:PKD domain-containing protein [Gillisia hiemivivida]|uniref:PKD domain-containing protein n=1 Tax=Gillisia hiemivivida TaxID=291190 RepID=A0A5C6ZZF4_9FLAO|nr:PKD domain-containing protein [Gillisia hiemivivida]TXD95701.1 hypothetical protein ES724_01325 [Gillisia hiemivivida]
MKIFQFLAMLTISVLLFTGCEKEEITNYAFQEISAPTSVTANFDVAQDDSGDVSITPSGEGAQVFQVYFGDGNDTPVEVAPGETVSYTYGEGEYLVRVIAVGSTGLTSEFNQRLLISFKAPENLVVNVDQPANNPATISVSASADFAASFDVYFGDAEDEEPTQLMPDASIEHTYASPGTYTIRVVAKGAGVATTETTVEVVIPEANDPVKLPITYDIPTVNYALVTFNDASFEVVTNPFLSGANPEESMVGAITNSGANFEGGAYNLGEPVDFSGDNKTISMKFYSETPVSVLVKFEGGTNDDRPNEVSADHGGTGWEVLTFDFGSDAVKSFLEGADDNGQAFVPTGKYSTLVLFVEIGETTAGTFYFDDIMQEASTANCVAETEENIDPANGPINWTFKTDDPAFAFEGFGNVEASIASNPATDGINASCNVGKVVKNNPCESWAGLGKGLQTSIDFATTDKKVFTLKVLAENQATDVTLRLEFEPHPNVDPAEERVAQVTEVGVWQELTFDFSDVNDKTFKSIILYFERGAACDGDVYYFDDLKQTDGVAGGGTASTKTSFPVDFESAANGGAAANWSVFENVDNPPLEIINNPDMAGNTSATVAKFTARQAGAPFAGTITQLQTPFTLSASNSTVKVMVWKTVISDVGIKFENAAGGSTGEIKVANTKTNEWEELTFDFSGAVGDPNNTDITGLVVFPDFNDSRTQDNVVYFDNVTLNAAGSGGGSSGGTDPTAAAPTPTLAAANVISLFSEAYTDVAVDTWRTSWSSVDYTETTVDGNDVKLYSNLDFVGIETVSSQIDASGMTHFHVDYWTGNATVFRIKLVDFGADGGFQGGDDTEHQIEFNVTPNQWVSLDIPLADFTGLTTTENIAQYIFSAATAGEANVYIDNVYFHN